MKSQKERKKEEEKKTAANAHIVQFHAIHVWFTSFGIQCATTSQCPLSVSGARIECGNDFFFNCKCLNCVCAKVALRANNANGSIHVKKRTIDLNVYFSIRFDTICLCLIYTIYVRKCKLIQIRTSYVPILLIRFVIMYNMQASDNTSSNCSATTIAYIRRTYRKIRRQKREWKHGKHIL